MRGILALTSNSILGVVAMFALGFILAVGAMAEPNRQLPSRIQPVPNETSPSKQQPLDKSPTPQEATLQNAVTLDTIRIYGNINTGLTGNDFTDLPPGVSRITAAQLEQAQATTIPELVGRVPGVSAPGGVRTQGQSVSIHGFSRQSDIRILLDGAPKNFEKYRQGTVFVEPELLKRVEIEKGAATVRHGNGGFGGTVRLETKDAADLLGKGERWGGLGKTAYQSAKKQFLETGAVYGRSNFGTPVVFDSLASVTWRQGGDIRVGGGEVYHHSDSELTSFMGKLSGEYGGHKAKVSVVYGGSKNWGPFSAMRGQLTPSEYQIKKYGYREAMRRMLMRRELKDFASTFEHSFDGESKLVNPRIMASYSSTMLRATQPKGKLGSPVTFGTRNKAQYSDFRLELENVSNFAFGGVEHQLDYGIQYRHHDREVTMFDATKATRPEYHYGHYGLWDMPSGTQDIPALFIEDRMALTHSVTLTPGVRYDYVRSKGVPNVASIYNDPAAGHDYSPTSHHGFTPAVGMSWRVDPSFELFADCAYAFRAPVIDEIYSVQRKGTSHAKPSGTSRNLKAERNNTVSIGAKLYYDEIVTADDILLLRGSIYNNHIANPITRRFGSANLAELHTKTGAVPFYWNTPSYYTRGVEFEAHYENDFMFSDLGFTFMTGKRKGAVNDIYGPDTWVNDLTPTTLIATLGYKLPAHDITFGWTGTFVDAQKRTPYNQGTGYFYARPESRGYAVHDLFFSWRPDQGILRNSEFHLALGNLFDKHYEPYMSEGESAMPGRSLKLSFSQKF